MNAEKIVSSDFVVKRGNIALKIELYRKKIDMTKKELQVKYNPSYYTSRYYSNIISHCSYAIYILTNDIFSHGCCYCKGQCYRYKENCSYAEEERWLDRSNWLSYLEASEQKTSQVNSKLDCVVGNSDLQRYITEYI